MKDSADKLSYKNKLHRIETADNGITCYKKQTDDPYLYIRLAFRCLSSNRFNEASSLLTQASFSASIFYKTDSPDEREFNLEMQMLRIVMLFLTDKFMKLPPVE